ncbi:MAG: polyprenol monophosphomannose synthase [Candidatus Auribacter fodinae]|jgi:dolichol-phosphate mannosyltransferase|uniref:Polyprenol monophosphomannose synthase n=1 Tax=Candidatus Auribacter fodinae TaxID=2093366 RepID=A0A3A4RA36_9BACT|nr:MAG: polyprenol monophosphomannose synthase [Candidatus Auribacter fodinae]
MKTIVTLPTYNEAENIEEIILQILTLNDTINVLVIDDNSPDGTGKIVDRLCKNNNRIKIVHRYGQRGRGIAGIEGFLKAIELNADYIIEMDADFSHNPKYIPAMLEKIETCDLVIGSRFIRGGGETGRSKIRRIISILANLYIRIMLGFPVKDCSSGYRCFRGSLLKKVDFNSFQSLGPSIVSELLLHAVIYHNAVITEIPIVFEERHKGSSKLNGKILMHNLFFIANLFLRKIQYKFSNRRLL